MNFNSYGALELKLLENNFVKLINKHPVGRKLIKLIEI